MRPFQNEHEDPPVEGGYTGIDHSQIGGLGHVCGMYCDGQDRGGGCDVQDAYYAKLQRRTTTGSPGLQNPESLLDLTSNPKLLPILSDQEAHDRLLDLCDKLHRLEYQYKQRIRQLEDQLREIHERSKPR